jgi:hypothetical protein
MRQARRLHAQVSVPEMKRLTFEQVAGKGNILILLGIMLLYLANGVNYLRQQSIYWDEGSYSEYAIRYLKGSPSRQANPRRDNSMMPVVAFNMIPRAVEQLLHPGLVKQDNGVSDIMMGRYVTLFFSLFIILLLFLWGSELFGPASGLFAAFIFSVCPNNLASSSAVGADSYSVLSLLSVMYVFWRWTRSGSERVFFWLAFLVAFSQLVKQSLIHLYILLPLLYLVGRKMGRVPPVSLRMLGIFLAVQMVVINVGYYFHHSFMPLGDHRFMSRFFLGLQASLPRSLPIPFPLPFVEGLDMAKYYDQIGGGLDGISCFGKVTILGREATAGSFWYYYFVTLFFKTPIPVIILFLSAVLFSFRKWGWNEVILLFPVAYFLIYFSFFYRVQTGIRHVIFLYPFIFLVCSSLAVHGSKVPVKVLMASASVFLLLSIGKYWGNYYPYTNEFISDKKNAWKYVGASNLEMRQGNLRSDEYLKQHPDHFYATPEPRAGTFLVNTEDYLDIWNRGDYSWTRRGEIVGHVGYNWLLIHYRP